MRIVPWALMPLLCHLLLSDLHANDGIEQLLTTAVAAAEKGDHSTALDALDRAIKQAPEAPLPYYWRGRSHFCLGKIEPAVADFDRYVKLSPRAESRQWERGIALYYARNFERGAKQFELYQTYHDNDVENSVWRYLCLARTEGVEAAAKTMLPIKNDPRVPMMTIYDLYRGKSTPDDVLAAIDAGDPSDRERNARAFYAHLYIGLWHEAAGKGELAAKHVTLAEEHKIGHYMWDVARVHNELRRAK
jgi:lipoprotein NlpI